uniref:Aldehyde dehydrogenase 1 n=1 Tax=Cucumis melo TaxID=3656 RepID=A0A9I9DXB8_CUCME
YRRWTSCSTASGAKFSPIKSPFSLPFFLSKKCKLTLSSKTSFFPFTIFKTSHHFFPPPTMDHNNSHTHSNGKKSDSHLNIPQIKFTKLFINGQFVDSVSGKTFDTIDPRTEEVIATVAAGDKEDVDLAVKAARQAFDHGPWPRMSGAERGRIMTKLAGLIDEHMEELAALDTIDAGKSFLLGKIVDIPGAANTLRYYAGAADKFHGEVLKMAKPLHGYTLLEPIGVVGHIIPWNFPTTMFWLKVSPALAAGCTMIVKPAEQTPLSALFYAHLAKLAGIPDGVLNVVTGYGSTAGSSIANHMDIDKVSFTGSTKVGRLIMQAASASNLKQVSLELGGKSPLLIFNDADLQKATDLALLAIFYNKGEICVAGSRVLVQEGIYDEFVKKITEKAKSWLVGDPFDPKVKYGPQVDKKQMDKILKYIEHGKREGATLVTGGNRIGNVGYYIEPTIFTDVEEDSLIAQDEIFGPVLSVIKFKTIEDGIRSANNTKYGLAAGIVTNSLDIANTVSRSIRAGTIWINCYFAFDPSCPFGGYKESGFGRDSGMHAINKYLQIKSVVTPLVNTPWL